MGGFEDPNSDCSKARRAYKEAQKREKAAAEKRDKALSAFEKAKKAKADADKKKKSAEAKFEKAKKALESAKSQKEKIGSGVVGYDHPDRNAWEARFNSASNRVDTYDREKDSAQNSLWRAADDASNKSYDLGDKEAAFNEAGNNWEYAHAEMMAALEAVERACSDGDVGEPSGDPGLAWRW